MFSLTRYTTPCPEPVNSQILQMVVDNLTDISSVALAPSNLLYNIYQYAIGFEVHLYLEALNGEKGIAVELVVAMEDETVVGFCLYLPVKDDPNACGIAFMAVQAGFRRQGVARSMLDEVLAHDGFGSVRVDVRLLKRGQKEVIVDCGKQYRFVVDIPVQAPR